MRQHNEQQPLRRGEIGCENPGGVRDETAIQIEILVDGRPDCVIDRGQPRSRGREAVGLQRRRQGVVGDRSVLKRLGF